ncbi:MAG: oligopeptide:H+ symporter [Crocinitomicaceae bacterium]|nr:oligopeptide:H+ symporter [Crocinitomicaceae bacterium]
MKTNQRSHGNPALPQLFGHPKGMFFLFFAELWERFSFYGMRALLVLYMTTQLLYSDEMSLGVYAAYGSLVYATPLIGGMLADRILGYRKAIILGGILMAIGHIMMTVETPFFFYMSLAIVIVGNGFFKPNISSLVGSIYEGQEEKREAGFTIFYLGVNLGGMLAPLMCAWVGLNYGWHYGFGLAGLGMILGIVFFLRGTRSNLFGEHGKAPKDLLLKTKSEQRQIEVLVLVAALISVPFFAGIIYFHEYEHWLVILVTIAITILLSIIMKNVSKVERQRLSVVVYFTVLATVFWAIFEQAGSSLTLFADRNVNLIGLNAAQTNSINSFFIMLLAIPFSILWTFLTRKGKNPSSPVKFAFGLILLGVGYLTFGLSAYHSDANAHVPMFYLILGTFIYTIGEMFLSPVGLTKATELSPVKFSAFIMGLWLLASFYGHFFSGQIAKLTAIGNGDGMRLGSLEFVINIFTGLTPEKVEGMPDGFKQLYQYVSIYTLFGVIAIGVGAFALIISPIIRKKMHGIH